MSNTTKATDAVFVLFLYLCLQGFVFWQSHVGSQSPSSGPIDTSVHGLTKSGDLSRLREISDPGRLNSRDQQGRTPLAAAALANQEAVVLFLLDQGADLNATDNRGNSIFLLAVDNNCEAMAVLLAKRGANFLRANLSKLTPLHAAARNGNTPMTYFLLENGAPPNAQESHSRYTPLHFAAARGHEQIVKLLLKYGADPSLRLDYGGGWTAPDLASGNKRPRVLQIFQEYRSGAIQAQKVEPRGETNFAPLITPEVP
jgi:ankyrin repeat protein